MPDDRLYTRLTIALLSAMILVMAVSAAVPRLDIWVSAQFFEDGRGFPAAQSPTYEWLGNVLRWVFEATAAVAFVLMVVAALRGVRWQTGWRVWAFLFLTTAIGPGLIVNALFKAHFGRARPATILEFGGDKTFTPPFQIAGECARNCSFSSGEGALVAAVVIPVLVLAWPRLGGVARWAAGAAGVGLIIVTAGLRVIKGRHFLSDTLISILLSALVALLLYRLLRVGPERHRLTGAALRADLGWLGGGAVRLARAVFRRERGDPGGA
ncbi:MAG: phosphatase PAP2 family protein [Rhodobacteraceae bacterium]|nr:phosphatase PAP2 family protein [Paracoccaceae bacterium]